MSRVAQFAVNDNDDKDQHDDTTHVRFAETGITHSFNSIELESARNHHRMMISSSKDND